MNKWLGVGNICRDPEYTTTQSGVSKCTFTVACQRRYANAQGVREADFINCVAWRQTADFIQRHFIKGNKIGIEGTIQTRSYDAQDGSKRYVTEIIVDNVEFVAPRQSSNAASPPPQPPAAPRAQVPPDQQQRMDFYQQNGFTEVDDDELPF